MRMRKMRKVQQRKASFKVTNIYRDFAKLLSGFMEQLND